MKNNIEVAAIQAKDLRPAVVSHGSVSVIGRRRMMEDTVATEKLEPYYFFGVYDGHGGASVANACRDRLHKLLEKEVVQELACQVRGTVDWERAMTSCFLTMDREVGGAQANSEEYGSTVGSTAVVAMVGTEDIVVANCGDSRAILFSSGLAVPLSRDHKVLFHFSFPTSYFYIYIYADPRFFASDYNWLAIAPTLFVFISLT